MFSYNRILIYCGVFAACSTCSGAYFLNWGSSETIETKTPIQHWPIATYYPYRTYQPPQTPYTTSNDAVEIPAIPIQVPIQAQLSPATNIHNVQLVPCLCPVSQDPELTKYQERSAFMTPLPQQHAK